MDKQVLTTEINRLLDEDVSAMDSILHVCRIYDIDYGDISDYVKENQRLYAKLYAESIDNKTIKHRNILKGVKF